MEKPRSAAVYARISSDPTGLALGVQRQLEDCRKLAADRGWTVGAEYVDNDVSAFSGKDRPEYERMLADVRDGLRDAVIVYNMDRLTRRPIELEQFAQVCEAAGVRQVATVTADVDLGTDDGLFTARIFAAFADDAAPAAPSSVADSSQAGGLTPASPSVMTRAFPVLV